MRRSIILPEKYEHLFVYEAAKDGFVKEIPSYADELYDPIELYEARENYKHMLNGMNSQRQKVFQMALLFDEVIVDKAVMTYDYENLIKTGFFKIIDFEEFYKYDPIHEEGHIEFAQYLKPAIIPVLSNKMKNYFPSIPLNMNFIDFVSAFYDTVLMKKKLMKKYQDLIEVNRKAFDERHKDHYEEMKRLNAPEATIEKRYYLDITYHVSILYETLCWQLMISSQYESAIMNCEFQLAKIGCESYEGNVESSMQAYQVLRVECAKIINTLPAINSFRDVIKLKETRRNDINNLRQELSRLEQEIRDGRPEKAIEKAAKDISKASRALTIGNDICKIDKWTNYLLLPVELAGLFTGSVPMIIGGGITTAVGRASSIVGQAIINKNKWFEIII